MTDTTPDPSDRPNLGSTGWALLGMLSGGDELSGYDIKKWINWAIRFFYTSPAYSQIYSELKRLENLGLLTSRMEGTARQRRMYKITDSGLHAVTRWANEEPVEPPMLKHFPLLRVIFGHLATPGRLKELLTEHLEHVDRMQQAAATEVRWTSEHPAWSYAHLALQWSERYYAAERELVVQLINELDSAEGTFSAADRQGMEWPVREYWYEIERRIAAEE